MNQLLHEDAEKIVSAGIHAVLPDVAVIRALESYDFGTGGVYLVAAGKAAWQMAHAAVSCLSGRIRRGVVITKYGHSGGPLAGIACFEGGHPIPDEGSCRGTRAALALVRDLGAQDTVVFLLSGGAVPCLKSRWYRCLNCRTSQVSFLPAGRILSRSIRFANGCLL